MARDPSAPAAPPLYASRTPMVPVWLLAVYLFVLYGRIFDIVLPQFHLGGVLILSLLALALLSGGYAGMFRPRVAKIWIVFNLLILFSIPFSVWRGGSFGFLVGNWWRVAPLPFLILRFATDMKRLRILIGAVAWGVAVLAISTLLAGGSIVGRVMGAGARFSDSNLLGMVLLFGAAFWCCFAAGPRIGLVRGVVSAVLLFITLGLIMKTGSRGTMVGFVGVMGYLFLRAPLAGKAAVLTLSVLAGVFAIELLPARVSARYFTLFGRSDPGIEELQGAVDSAQARRELLRRSALLMLHHPILGVGPNMFMVAEHDYALDRGEARGNWHVSHNMLGQVGSELGIPALICFVSLLVISWRTATRLERAAKARRPDPAWRQIGLTAFWMKAALLSLCLTGFFLNIAYDEQIPIVFATIAAVAFIAELQAAADQPSPPATGILASAAAPARS